MKTIVVELSDALFQSIRNFMKIKIMMDEAHGEMDVLVGRMLIAIEKGEEKISLKLKNEKD
jgi:hypothetical protein